MVVGEKPPPKKQTPDIIDVTPTATSSSTNVIEVKQKESDVTKVTSKQKGSDVISDVEIKDMMNGSDIIVIDEASGDEEEVG